MEKSLGLEANVTATVPDATSPVLVTVNVVNGLCMPVASVPKS